MTKAELLALRARLRNNAIRRPAPANPLLLACTSRILATLSPHVYERYAVMTWLYGDRDTITEGEVAELNTIFPISTNADVAASRALFADMLALTRVPA